MTDTQRDAFLTAIVLVLAAVVAVVVFAVAHAEPLPPMPPAEPPAELQGLPRVQPGGVYVWLPMIAMEVNR